jgi:hypothetical protein
MSGDGLNRRGFLGLVSAAPLGQLLLPSGVGAPRAARERSSAPAGIILPRSRVAQGLTRAFRDGCAIALAGSGATAPIVEEIAVGGIDADAAAERLCGAHGLPLVIGALDDRRAAEVERQLGERALYVEMGFGALVPGREPGARTRLLCSQGAWASAYALGRWAGAPGRRAAMVATLFDAGYDGLHAFRLGFEEAGGTIVATEVLDVPGRERVPGDVLGALAAHAPDAIYASCHDHQGALLLRAFAERTAAERASLARCQLLASPQLASVANLAHAPALRLHTVATYDPALALPANAAFVSAFRSHHGALPDGTAVAGWEAGRLIAAAASSTPTPTALREAILATVLDSPRGRVAFDRASGVADSPHYLVRCSADASGVRREVLGTLGVIGEHDERVRAWQRAQRSGWTNPYLSV